MHHVQVGKITIFLKLPCFIIIVSHEYPYVVFHAEVLNS